MESMKKAARWGALSAICVLSTLGSAQAQTPLGKWWAQDSIRRELALTDAQSHEIERLFQAVLPQLHSALEEVHKEEALANADHSEVEMERWDDEEFKVQDAAKAALKARAAYKDALREKNYGF